MGNGREIMTRESSNHTNTITPSKIIMNTRMRKNTGMVFTVIHTTMNTDTITLTDRPYIADAPLPVPPDKRPYGL